MNTEQNKAVENEQIDEQTPENVIQEPKSEETSPKGGDNEKTQKLEAELAEAKDKYLRLYSEFENFRRRTSKEKVDIIGAANEQLMLSLLPVVDDIERSKSTFDSVQDIEALKEGVSLIYNKLQKTLEQKGLKPLNAKGEAFNPDIHEAITQIPSPSEDLKGKVVDEIEKGYYLNEKLIRVSKVVIGA